MRDVVGSWRTILVWVVVVAVATTWGIVDVRHRARLSPTDPLVHKTDFTVYTVAGEAMFDGRDPYEVTNARGWHYLYPPLFAIVVAPLAHLPTTEQGLIWFALSCLCVWGSVVESRRLWRWGHPLGVTTKPWVVRFIVSALVLGVAFPMLNCLQRGQVGVVLVYFLLLGARLVLTQHARVGVVLGGVVMALPVAIKLTPLLPAAVLCGGLLVGEVCWRTRVDSRVARGAWSCAGGLLGLLLWLWIVPGIFVGWGDNQRHLQTWVNRVVLNERVSQDNDFNARSQRNQNFKNAAHRLGNFVLYQVGAGPDDTLVDIPFNQQLVMPTETRAMKWFVNAANLALLVALAWHVIRCASAPTPAGVLALFGLGCTGTLIVSPIAWGHHYVMQWPAMLFMPLYLLSGGRPRLACWFAGSAAFLMVGHYAVMSMAARIGLLGLGTTMWCWAALVLMRGRIRV